MSERRIGTAGWSIPRAQAAAFGAEGTGLARYAGVLRCVEINSTFYRPHRASTFARWAEAVPEDFRFSLKAPKTITHEGSLAPAPAEVRAFLEQIGHLGQKLGPILLQLPPRQQFDRATAQAFLSEWRNRYPTGAIVLEPRHRTWFTAEAEAVLEELRIARVAADPPLAPEASQPAGDKATVYYRLHGSPRVYYSSYTGERMEALAAEMKAHARESVVWCIFDNTASGAAMENALGLIDLF
ncbi:MAG: DUF72 domain-containing protein [Janthinobacterium lividum]